MQRRINLDNAFSLLESALIGTSQLPNYWAEQAKVYGNYPPYNLIKNKEENKFKIIMAVAGFNQEELSVTVDKNQLIVTGEKLKTEENPDVIYIHHGIAERNFKRTFDLGEYIEVKNVKYKYGMLKIELELVLPESKKPKSFHIFSED